VCNQSQTQIAEGQILVTGLQIRQVRRDREFDGRESRVEHAELDLERLGRVDVGRSDAQQVNPQSTRITYVGRAITDA
jgi:hypothetical protein